MMPASESSEKPIIMSSDSNFLRWVLAVEAELMLLSVSATNWINFYWVFMCCRMPMMTYSKVSFLSSSYLDCELMSVTKARISKICSFTSIPTYPHISTRSKARMFCVTAGANVSSL